MYDLKPILPIFEITMPTNMYKLNPVSLDANACHDVFYESKSRIGNSCPGAENKSRVSNDSQNNNHDKHPLAKMPCALDLDVLGAKIQQIIKSEKNGANDVAKRQEVVLKQLQSLEVAMREMRSCLVGKTKDKNETAKQKSSNIASADLKKICVGDIVINAHPKYIPYALLALRNLWKDCFELRVRTHKHSSMPHIGPNAEKFVQNLTKPYCQSADSFLRHINITLIWMDCEHTEMISSPTMYVPIYGEVNIVRYLARVGPENFRFEDSIHATDIDSTLDICYQLLRLQTPKSRAKLFDELNKRLGKTFFHDNKLTIADVIVCSTLMRIPNFDKKELTSRLNKWWNDMPKTFGLL